MTDVRITTKVRWTFDRPVKVSYEYHGKLKSFSVTGAEYRIDGDGRYAWLIGYELLKSGRPRKGKAEGLIFPHTTISMIVNGEWMTVETPAKALIDRCRSDGQAYLDRHFGVAAD
jgi:hypothetical protein